MRTVIAVFVRVVDRLSTILLWVGAVGVFYLMLAGVVDVVLRNSGLPTIPGSYEYMELVLVCVAYFSAAYVQREGGHIDTNMVTGRLSDRASRVVRATALGVTVLVLVWASWAATVAAIASTARGETKFGVFNFPIWPGRVVVAIGLILLTIQVAITLARLITDKTALREEAPLHVGL